MKRFVAATVFVALSGLFLATADVKACPQGKLPKGSYPGTAWEMGPNDHLKSRDLGPGPGVRLFPRLQHRPGPFSRTSPRLGGDPKKAIPITVPAPRARGSWQRSAPVPQPVPSPGRLHGPSLRVGPRLNLPKATVPFHRPPRPRPRPATHPWPLR